MDKVKEGVVDEYLETEEDRPSSLKTQMEIEDLRLQLEALKDDHTSYKVANERLQLENSHLRGLEQAQELLGDETRCLRKERNDYEQTVRAIGVLVGLHQHKYPPPPQKTAEEFYNQFGPLVEASDNIRDWLVDNWSKVNKLVQRINQHELSDEFKDIKIADPSSKLIALDKALHLAQGGAVRVESP